MIDTFPTMLELAGVKVPEGTQGISLLPQLKGKTDKAHEEVLVETDEDPWGVRLRTLISDRWKIITYAGMDFGEIYDLENDPHELDNLWDKCDTKIKQKLTKQLLDLIIRNQDMLPPKTCPSSIRGLMG